MKSSSCGEQDKLLPSDPYLLMHISGHDSMVRLLAEWFLMLKNRGGNKVYLRLCTLSMHVYKCSSQKNACLKYICDHSSDDHQSIRSTLHFSMYQTLSVHIISHRTRSLEITLLFPRLMVGKSTKVVHILGKCETVA